MKTLLKHKTEINLVEWLEKESSHMKCAHSQALSQFVNSKSIITSSSRVLDELHFSDTQSKTFKPYGICFPLHSPLRWMTSIYTTDS